MPRFVVCHICGREFGTSSIGIHIPQCTKKWEAQEAKKPKAKQRPVPTAPPLEDPGSARCEGGDTREHRQSREEYNEAALQKWNDEALLPCDICGRTFLPDRLEIHQRSCKPPPGQPPPMRCRPVPKSTASNGTDGLDDSFASRSDDSPPGKTGAPGKPRAVVCHICGREFGTKSIDIHLPQCMRKWEEREQQKPAHARKPVPSAPTREEGVSNEVYNEAALEKWNSEALSACPTCGRTFLPDRLEVHMRSCKSKDGTVASVAPPPAREPEIPGLSARPKAAFVKPKAVVCHICGREFGSTSIAIHLKQCQKKWEDQEAKKPKAKQRPVPSTPVKEAGASLREYNEAALQTWDQEALLPCPKCGRTFLPDRLEVHLRSCKGEGTGATARPAVVAEDVREVRTRSSSNTLGKTSAPAAPLKPRAVVCHICGREFGTKSIDIHVPQCAQKWKEREAAKPVHERRPVPTAPDEQSDRSTPAYNEAALEKWNSEALLACPNCGRTFLPDRLEVHLRSCKPADGQPQAPLSASPSRPRSGTADSGDGGAEAKGPGAFAPSPRASSAARTARPRTVVCQICGREFGSASIDIHRRQCEERWRTQEAKKPASARKPVPEAPAEPRGGEKYNEAALQKWNDEALDACPNCGRTFLPDRLQVHLRSCKPKP